MRTNALNALCSTAILSLATTASWAQVTIIEYPILTQSSVPFGITGGPDGNLWFTESGANKIGRITPLGVMTEFAPAAAPLGITNGPDGNLWFTENNAKAIGRITPAGTITHFPIKSDSPPNSITSGPDGNLWFTELENNRIGRITPEGVITEFKIPTYESSPKGITSGPDGNLWFAESGAPKIGKITPLGVITEFTNISIGNADGITAGPDGNLWFAEQAGEIGRITTTGVVTQFPVLTRNGTPAKITSAADGNLWFTELTGNNVGRITTTGVVTEFPIPTPSSEPLGITSGPDGNVWFVESSGNKIGTFAVASPPELYWGLTVVPGASGFANMVWSDLDGIPGPPPVPATPPIPIPSGAWTIQIAPWWMDAVQAPAQPAVFLLLTDGYLGDLRAYRSAAGSFAPCGSYPLTTGDNGGVRVSPSGSFALVAQGSSPYTSGGLNVLLKFPLSLQAPGTVTTDCLLPGAPTQIPVPANSAIRNIDFKPYDPTEVVVSGYSNVVSFVNPVSGVSICDVTLTNGSQPLTVLEARYRPDGMEVWAVSYDARQIAVIAPPPACSVTGFISDGFGPYDYLYGASFHPDAGVYYVTSYTAGHGINQMFVIDTGLKSIITTVPLSGAAGMTAVTRGPRYLLEVPTYGCCPQFGFTSTYDVSDASKARNPGGSLIGEHASSVNMRNITTLRNVQP